MGNCEETKACKSEKSSSPAPAPAPAPDQTSIHVYPDWAAMQAYYGPRVAVPPYFNSAVAPGHAPHPYMWGPPQHMMPPYGASYAAIYPHGGVYAHPGVPIAATPMSNDSPAKSSGNSDRGLMKKLKGFDGLGMSIGTANTDSGEGGNDNGISQSGETEGSSEGSDGNTTGRARSAGKRSREGTPDAAELGKTLTQSVQVPSGEAKGASKKVNGVTVIQATISDKLVGTMLSASPTTELELRDSPTANAKTTALTIQPCTVITNEVLLQNERELKRERRKQSNRESARRSRLRKQAEAEELSVKVESLTTENLTLKSEINRLTDNSEKLKLQNAVLMEKLKSVQHEQIDDPRSEKKGSSLSTANLLSRVNNSGSVVRNDGEGEMYENNSNSGTKLRQLLDASPRADAVAAG